ncbi:alkyl/aryl-sulfatase [Dermatobacter hominis]|uniref:alkyl/aryl-sulfatase n=1 Tax=Dermatobacter hominis TaxID=2884263 RepID=UPI001D11DF13|nr:alkyl sulfatase dimerization domain-containing protein [Dermatobacter hominis]UDY34881.1 MBL fold metallo-hydrolase [Dermatobacter hominis]
MTGPDLSPKPATPSTAAANDRVAGSLPFADRTDFDLAERGRVTSSPQRQITGEGGGVTWDLDSWSFLEGPAPDTVNPSLWRQSQLCSIEGLFEVVDGIHQVRGFDLSNITFVRGETGWIVIDPLTSAETARAALDLANQELGERPVRAVIYTHSHVDHFAGVRGITTDEDVAAGRVRIIAPSGFLEAAISENVIAGNVMTRRATYMYGTLLPRGPQGLVGSGLGQTAPLGTFGLIAPTELISATGTELVVDGVRIEFQLTPGTEAPAEMNFLFPDHRALCMAENCTAVFHNVYTPRGAQIRDALGWSTYLHESLELYADRADVSFASHHWPRWGAEAMRHHLASQRDLYRYLHDQTMRLANHGLTMLEIAEELALPPSLGDEFFNRDYYGTLNHNVKAVYQRYLGFFDGNPAHLHPLPPVESGRRYVEFMGGADELLRRAQESFDAGDYRWVAQVVDHLVFADPENMAARALQADALEQLGYQSESGPWRSFYLTGAQELRTGPPPVVVKSAEKPDVMAAMTVDMLLQFVGVRLNGPRAAGLDLSFTLEVRDASAEGGGAGAGEVHAVGLANGALHHRAGGPHPDAGATVSTTHAALVAAITAGRLDQLADDGDSTVDGDVGVLSQLSDLLDDFELFFPIVTP